MHQVINEYAQWRQQSLELFTRDGFPTKKNEHWRYTDLNFLAKKVFFSSERFNAIGKITYPTLEQAYHLVFINGFYSEALSSTIDLTSVAEIFTVPEAFRLKILANEYTNLAPPTACARNRLLHWNAGSMTDGLVIRIPRNCALTKPIQLLFITTGSVDTSLYYAPRNIFLLEEHSQAVIFEEHVALNADNYVKNSVMQIDIKPGAKLQYYKLQQEAPAAVHLANTQISQAKDSHLLSFSISLGAELAREDLTVALNEPGATCDLKGLYITAGKQHVDHHTRIDHYAAHTTSVEQYKGILSGESTGVYNGKVIVHPKAQKICSQQTNKNLLLSPKAHINTKPELEIYADDVQCTHGATVSSVEAESLFYLRSRGLDAASAEAVLVQAFAEEILAQMAPEIRSKVIIR